MKLYTNNVSANRVSVRVEPIPGTNFARVQSHSSERPDTNVDWVRPIDARLFEGTYLPVSHHASCAVAVLWMFDTQNVTAVAVYDACDGWHAEVVLPSRRKTISGYGCDATPVGAIREAKRAAKRAARTKSTQ